MGRRLDEGHHSVTVHDRFQRPERVHLGDYDVGAHAAGPHGYAAGAPPVAADDEGLPSDHDAAGAEDAVDGALPRAVPIVEHHLGGGVVDCHHGVLEGPVLLHGPEPVYARGGLLAASLDVGDELGPLPVDAAHQVAAVVHGELRLPVHDAVDAPAVLLACLLPPRVDLGSCRRQRRHHRVLGGQRVGPGEGYLGAPRLQSPDEHRRLLCAVEHRPNGHALEEPLLLEAPPYEGQHGHVVGSPVDQELALLGESNVFDLIVQKTSP